jgi:hypothetical protein
LLGGADTVVTPTAIAAFVRMGGSSMRYSQPELTSRPDNAARDGSVLLDDIAEADAIRNVPEPAAPSVASMKDVTGRLMDINVVGQSLRVIDAEALPSNSFQIWWRIKMLVLASVSAS